MIPPVPPLRRPLPPALAGRVLLVLAAGLAACGEQAGSGSAEAASPSSPARIEADLRDLTAALSPADPTAPTIERHNWYGRRADLLERLRQGGPELGRAALERYRASEAAPVEVRIGMLDVAAHTAPEEAQGELVALITTYGPDPGLRASACELLAVASPETALRVLEPIVTTTDRGMTYPPEDRMLEAWLAAARALERDPSEVLARIVTDPELPQEARHLAARSLGEQPGSVGRQALETVLTESGGNNYLRRLAAQSLQRTLPADQLCPTLRQVFEREADLNFQIFLSSMLEKHCP